MNTLMPFLALDQTCENVREWMNQQLTGAGYRVVQTFDLQVARLAHPDRPCAFHGTENCDCQMIVLLIYHENEDPLTVVIHGQDHRTWLSLAYSAGQRGHQRLDAAIRHTLFSRLPNTPSPIEVVHEAQSTA